MKNEEEEKIMETSTEEQRNRSEETYGLDYSPCYFFDKVIKSFLKCLGHDSTTEQPQPQHPDPLHAEREMKLTTEDFAVNVKKSSRGLRRPPRPPISSGGGGQIN